MGMGGGGRGLCRIQVYVVRVYVIVGLKLISPSGIQYVIQDNVVLLNVSVEYMAFGLMSFCLMLFGLMSFVLLLVYQ